MASVTVTASRRRAMASDGLARRIRPGMAEQLSLRTILSQKGLLPPQGVPTGSVRYRIQLESAEPLEDIATATMQPIQMSGTPGAPRHRLSPLLARIFWDNRL